MERRRSRRGSSCRRCPADARRPGGVALRAPGLQGPIGVPERGAKRKLMEIVTQNAAGGVPAAQAEARVGLRGPVAGAHRAGRRSSACRRRRCGSSATTSRTWGRPTRSAPWWCSRTGCRSGPTTGGSRSRTSPDRTISRAWKRCSAGGSRGCIRGAGRARRVHAGGGSRTRRRSSWWTAARGSSAWQQGAGRRRPGHPAHRPGQAAGGGLLPRQPDPLMIPRGVRGVVRPAAPPRRGAPVRRSPTTAQKRAKRALVSPLDDVPGVGPARKKALLKRFGSLARLRDASPDEIAATPGIGPELARSDRRPAPRRRPARREPGERLMPRAVRAARPMPDERGGVGPAFTHHHRAVRRRPVRGRPLPRGPRLLRRRQPAARAAAARWPSSRSRPGGPARVAIVVDARGGVFFGELSKALEELDQERIGYRILYLDAADDDLVNRYEATRRRHPLAPADRVVEGIRKERLMMESLRGDADLLIDTSRPDAARAPRAHPRRVRRGAARARAAGLADLVRLQVRRPARLAT